MFPFPEAPEPESDDDPPWDDMDWLWFKPAGMGDTSLHPSYNVFCRNCAVFEVHSPDATGIRCWNCGRFIHSARAYSTARFQNYSTSPTLWQHVRDAQRMRDEERLYRARQESISGTQMSLDDELEDY